MGRGFVRFMFHQFVKVLDSEGYGISRFSIPYLKFLPQLFIPSQPLLSFLVQRFIDFRKIHLLGKFG